MPTTWDPTKHATAMVLSNGDLTATNSGISDADVLATDGFEAGATQDVSWIANRDAVTSNSYDFGLAVGTMSLTARPQFWPSTGTPDSISIQHNGKLLRDDFVTLADVGAFSAGDKCEVRLKNGKVYFRRYIAASSTWGAWNGTSGLYSGADPDNDTGGVPVASAFGSTTLLYPLYYADQGGSTADFTNWVASSSPPVSVPDQAYIDPHDAPYNAKGDAFGGGDGVANTAGTEFSSPSYTFTSDDIGKELWVIDAVKRVITSVSGGAVTGWSGAGPIATYDARIWFIGTDDTAAIQAALDDAAALAKETVPNSNTNATSVAGGFFPGGLVRLRPGHGYLIRNSQANWDAYQTNNATGKRAALLIHPRVGLIGAGPGFGQTVLHLAMDHYGHGIATSRDDVVQDFSLLHGFALYCYTKHEYDAPERHMFNENVKDGIHFALNGGDQPKVDAFNRISHIYVAEAGEACVFLKGRGEFFGEDIQTYGGKIGIHTDHMVDYTMIRCNSGGATRTGIRVVNSPNGNWHACKSYSSGFFGTTYEERANWSIECDWIGNGFVHFYGCEAQEAKGSCWVINSMGTGLHGCWASEPGRMSMYLDENGDEDPFGTGRFDVVAGFHIKGEWAQNILLDECKAMPSPVGYNQTRNWGWGNFAVYIDGMSSGTPSVGPNANRGVVRTLLPYVDNTGTSKPGMVYDTTNPAGSGYGDQGGAGFTNSLNFVHVNPM